MATTLETPRLSLLRTNCRRASRSSRKATSRWVSLLVRRTLALDNQRALITGSSGSVATTLGARATLPTFRASSVLTRARRLRRFMLLVFPARPPPAQAGPPPPPHPPPPRLLNAHATPLLPPSRP